MWGAGELAMTPHDLALWDISMITQSLMQPASYRAQQTDMLLANGLATGYGLGIGVGRFNGHRVLAHGGAVSGYTSRNTVFPDDSAAIVVLTNIYPGAAGAPDQIAGRIASIILPQADTAQATALEEVKAIYAGLMRGEVDRTPVHAQLQRLLRRDRAAGLRGEPGPARRAHGVHAGRVLAPRRHGHPLLSHPRRRCRHGTHHHDDAGREDRAVHRVAGRVGAGST